MQLKSVKETDIKNKSVFLRVALDVPFLKKNGFIEVSDDTRIKASLPTIKYLLKNNCKIILASYLKRPGGKVVEEYRLDPVARRLSELLEQKVKKLNDCVGQEIKTEIKKMKARDIILLENTRFHKEEDENNEKFAKELSSYADIFIEDAFAQSHRKCASVVAICKFLPSYAGFLLEKEVNTLSRVTGNPKRPLVALIGGAKISTKMILIKEMLKRVDYLLLGGALANTILKAQGIQVGKSLVEPDMIKFAESLALTDTKLKIPIDIISANEISEKAKTQQRAVANVGLDQIILDIGQDTVDLFCKVINIAKTVIWNGPVGYFEIDKFASGTRRLAECIANTDCESIVGGGETIETIKNAGLENKFSFISTGGGAMLEFLEGKMLPGIKPLLKN